MTRLVLIDAYAIIHRAYHAYPALSTPNGQLVNAVYGFSVMLLKVIDELQPTHMIVCFDLPTPTFRHVAYIGYQATRPPTHEDIRSQVSLVREVIDSADIPIFAHRGFEADDVIGTLAHKAVRLQTTDYGRKKKRTVVGSRSTVDEVVIVTGDRDMLQLVTEHVKVYMPIKGISEAKLLDASAVKEYLGIPPAKVVDYKGLSGDASDNYPGVPGIGPKTAIALLEQFGSLNNIYEAIHNKNQKTESIGSKVLEKLVNGYDLAMMSQKLARISTDVPIEFDLEKAILKDPRTNEKFINKIRELNFKSLLGRLGVVVQVTKRKPKDENQMNLI